VVKNEGEPGGGPFWVRSANGSLSIQICEQDEIDPKVRKEVFKNATHFNPVDLVLGVKNYRGRHFDLARYVDSNRCFISSKSENGKSLDALEHPGLWNRAMAGWITVLVEVPIGTFNPTKTVLDLLREQHQ
jgi:hypothetical protein